MSKDLEVLKADVKKMILKDWTETEVTKLDEFMQDVIIATMVVNKLPIHVVVCSCYLCGKSIEQPEKQFDMYGEIVCQSCWDYEMYQALQGGGGM